MMSNVKKKEKEEDKGWVFFNCTFLGLLQQLLSFFAGDPFCIDLILFANQVQNPDQAAGEML